MPYLYLVRHAQPDFTGHYDSVTELGLRQSAWLGEHFSARGLRFARVISGSLERQKGTLEAILQLGRRLQAVAEQGDERWRTDVRVGLPARALTRDVGAGLLGGAGGFFYSSVPRRGRTPRPPAVGS